MTFSLLDIKTKIVAKVKNWAYPLDNIGKPTPPVKKAVSVKTAYEPSIQDYNQPSGQYEPPPSFVTSTGGNGPVYMATGSWTSSYNNIFNKPAPWPKFFEEPVQDEWSPAPPPIKTIPLKPVPGRLYPVINTGARVEKKVARKFHVYVNGMSMWNEKQNHIIQFLTDNEEFDVSEDKIDLNGTHESEWFYKVEEFYA